MKKILKGLLVCFAVLLLQNVYADNSPLGYWRTIDDVTGKPRSIIHIWKTGNGTLSGQLVTIYPSPGKDINEVCTACQGNRHNKRILGMVVMSGLRLSKDNPNEWSGGEILDPTNGKTYHFYINVIDNGERLDARGYIGLPLFGRTQTWVRVGGPNG